MALLDNLNINPQMLGLLGLSLMQASQPSTTPQNINLGLLPSMLAQQNQLQSTPNLPAQLPTQRQLQKEILSLPLQNTNMQNNNTTDMLTQLKTAAESTYPNNPTLQQVAISQAILESGLKPSKLATDHNNYFGIKGNDVNLPTTEYSNGKSMNTNAGFEANNSMADSFKQHRDLLNRRYQTVASASNPYDAFRQLQAGGYATDPMYARKLSNVYDRYVQPLYTTVG